jgi:hypothetical protein
MGVKIMKQPSKERVPQSIRWRVRDEAGRRPLHGVRVDLVAIEGDAKHILASAKTNAHGDYEMRLSTQRAVKLDPDSTLLVVHGIEGKGHGAADVAVAWQELLSGTLDVLVPLPTATGPWISGVNPQKVLPGSFVEINGAGFGNYYGDVVAWAGGREMIVLDVQPTQLLVRIPPQVGRSVARLNLSL